MKFILLLLCSPLLVKATHIWLSKSSSPFTTRLNIPEELKDHYGIVLNINISTPGIDESKGGIEKNDKGTISITVLVGSQIMKRETIEVKQKTINFKLYFCEEVNMTYNLDYIEVKSETDIINDKTIDFSLAKFDCSSLQPKSSTNVNAESSTKVSADSSTNINAESSTKGAQKSSAYDWILYIFFPVACIVVVLLLGFGAYRYRENNKNSVNSDDIFNNQRQEIEMQDRSPLLQDPETIGWSEWSNTIKDIMADKFLEQHISVKTLTKAFQAEKDLLLSQSENPHVPPAIKRFSEKKDLEQFGDKLIQKLALKQDKNKNTITNVLKRAHLADTGEVIIEEVEEDQDQSTSVYGFMVTLKKPDNNIIVAYAYHNLKFRLDPEKLISLTKDEIEDTKKTFGRYKALSWLKNKGLITGINYVD